MRISEGTVNPHDYDPGADDFPVDFRIIEVRRKDFPRNRQTKGRVLISLEGSAPGDVMRCKRNEIIFWKFNEQGQEIYLKNVGFRTIVFEVAANDIAIEELV